MAKIIAEKASKKILCAYQRMSAVIIKKKTNSASPIIHIPYQEAYKMEFRDVERRSPVLDKLKSLIGTFPQTSLEKAIDFMIAAKI